MKKFKSLTANKRPPVMSSILGEGSESKFSYPPTQMRESASNAPFLDHRSQSLNTDDRKRIETALVTEGVHRDLSINVKPSTKIATSGLILDKHSSEGTPQLSDEESDPEDALSQLQLEHDRSGAPRKLPPFRSSLYHARSADDTGRRGQAHDPLEDQLYLRIGPSTFAGHSLFENDSDAFLPDDVYAVSESPGAADVDIYETAYRDEIERILAKAREEEKEPQVYLTRRVDAKLLQLSGLAGKLVAHGEEAKTQFKDYTQFSARKARATEVSKALREAARAEYEKRRQERKAYLEAARAGKTSSTGSKPFGQKVDSFSSFGPDSASTISPRLADAFANKSAWKAKAVDRGRSAKTSVMGLVDLVKQKSRTTSKDDVI